MLLHNNQAPMIFCLLCLLMLVYFFATQSWDSFFANASAGAAPGQAYQAPPSLALPGRNEVPITSLASMSSMLPRRGSSPNLPSTSLSAEEAIVDDHLAVQAIIRSYQVIINYLSSLIKGQSNSQFFFFFNEGNCNACLIDSRPLWCPSRPDRNWSQRPRPWPGP